MSSVLHFLSAGRCRTRRTHAGPLRHAAGRQETNCWTPAPTRGRAPAPPALLQRAANATQKAMAGTGALTTPGISGGLHGFGPLVPTLRKLG